MWQHTKRRVDLFEMLCFTIFITASLLCYFSYKRLQSWPCGTRIDRTEDSEGKSVVPSRPLSKRYLRVSLCPWVDPILWLGCRLFTHLLSLITFSPASQLSGIARVPSVPVFLFRLLSTDHSEIANLSNFSSFLQQPYKYRRQREMHIFYRQSETIMVSDNESYHGCEFYYPDEDFRHLWSFHKNTVEKKINTLFAGLGRCVLGKTGSRDLWQFFPMQTFRTANNMYIQNVSQILCTSGNIYINN